MGPTSENDSSNENISRTELASIFSSKSSKSERESQFSMNSDACTLEARDVLTALKAQGLPALLGTLILPCVENEKDKSSEKCSSINKRRVSIARRFFANEFGNHVPWIHSDDASLRHLVRTIAGRTPHWRQYRSYVQCCRAEHNGNILLVEGWVKHAPLSPSHLLHVRGIGAMRIQSLQVFVTSDISMTPVSSLAGDCEESLRMEADSDICGEQTLPIQNTIETHSEIDNALRTTKRAQFDAWSTGSDRYSCNDYSDAAEGTIPNTDTLKPLIEDTKTDEVLVPDDVHAHIRFQRYRALESFRASSWDIYDSLPREYALANTLTNFDLARKSALKAGFDSGATAPVGTYVRVHLHGIANAEIILAVAKQLSTSVISPIFSLLKHENRLSVAHFLIQRVSIRTCESKNNVSTDYHDDEPLASKEQLLIRCGHRRWLTRPIFSQHSPNADNSKYMRFFRHGEHCVASVLGPITFAPAPCFFFRPTTGELVAVGHALHCNPNRIVLKRAVLTGLPARTHKRKAVIKYMFHNPDDVRYFKPAQLTTKHGLTCYITEPVGTHGHFKVALSKPMKQSDRVMLHLYKRVFPKLVHDYSDYEVELKGKEVLLVT